MNSTINEGLNENETFFVNNFSSLKDVFEHNVELYSDNSAVCYEDTNLSYEQLNSEANKMAHYLSRQGVSSGNLVGLSLERTHNVIISILALYKLGAAYVPLDTSYPIQRNQLILDDAKIQIIIAEQKTVGKLPGGDRITINLDKVSNDIQNESTNNLSIKVKKSDTAYVIYTSGTTGKPNGVMITHSNVLSLLDASCRKFEFSENDVWTMFHSYAFDFSVWELWGALAFGGKLLVVPYWISRDTEKFYNLVSKHNVTVLSQTPSAFYQFSKVDQQKNTNLNLRYIIFGGEALNFRALKNWVSKHGDKSPELVNLYGITETTVHATMQKINSEQITAGKSLIGSPLNHLNLYLLDEKMNLVEDGLVGEIYLSGTGLSKGYLHNTELTNKRFVRSPFNTDGATLYKTGDLARRISKNSLEYLGRSDHQIQIRGHRVELGDIRAALCEIKHITDAAVILQNENDEENLVAYLVVEKNQNIDISDIRNDLNKSLPLYMIPQQYIHVEAIPLTQNGKVDKRKLVQLGKEFKRVQKHVPPKTATEKNVGLLFEKYLKVDSVGVNDNFLDLGGHSIIAISLINDLKNSFGNSICMKDLYTLNLEQISMKIDNEQLMMVS